MNPVVQHGPLHGLGLSIRDFLTDGSLARMCDELSRMTGVPVWIRDREGLVIVPTDGGSGGGGGPWRVVDGHSGAMRAFGLVGRQYDAGMTLFIAPIRTSVGDIGSIVMPASWEGGDPMARRALERAVTILAATGVEHVEGVLVLRERVEALDALFRLSSLMVKADDPDKLLQSALDLAIDVLRMDAGTISVIDDTGGGAGGAGTGELRHKATRNLSQAWLSESSPMSIDGVLRTAALRGEVIAVTDVRSDPRIADAHRPAAEGIVSLMSTGLVFAGRAAGLIRLYSRTMREFTEQETGLLRSIADHAAMALAHARLRQLREQDQNMRRQLRLAADVQQRMLPRNLPQMERFELAARYVPSFQLGGDFYDVFEKRGMMAVAVGDVVGKGVPAALIMSAVRASMRAFAAWSDDLAAVMTAVNEATARDTLESEFVTLWGGVLNPEDLSVTYCSAGHEPAMLFRGGGGGEVEELATENMALGIDAGQPYKVGRAELKAGDVLLIHTDGLSDASDFESKRFTRQRIRDVAAKLLKDEPGATAGRIVEHLMWTVRQFAGVRMGSGGGDDITLVVVRVR